MGVKIVCLPCCDVINFEINHIFLIKVFFCMTETSRQKTKNLKNEKSFQGGKKYFTSFLKDFQLPKTVSDLRVRFY